MREKTLLHLNWKSNRWQRHLFIKGILVFLYIKAHKASRGGIWIQWRLLRGLSSRILRWKCREELIFRIWALILRIGKKIRLITALPVIKAPSQTIIFPTSEMPIYQTFPKLICRQSPEVQITFLKVKVE